MDIIIAAFLFCAIYLEISLSGKLFERSQSLKLTGNRQPAPTLGYCAVLCQAEESCVRAEFRQEKEICIMSQTQGPLYLGKDEPDLAVPVSNKNMESRNANSLI